MNTCVFKGRELHLFKVVEDVYLPSLTLSHLFLRAGWGRCIILGAHRQRGWGYCIGLRSDRYDGEFCLRPLGFVKDCRDLSCNSSFGFLVDCSFV